MRYCDPNELHPICPAQYTINDCGRPVPPPLEFVDLPAVLVFSTQLSATATQANARKRVPEGSDFILTSISAILDPAAPAADYLYKLQFPDGRYASQARESALLTFAVGNRRRIIAPAELYPAGSFISIELEPTGTATTVVILFEGLKRIYLSK